MNPKQQCEICEKRPARSFRCPGDNGQHHHGMIHTPDGMGLPLLVAVCFDCFDTVANAWARLQPPMYLGDDGGGPTFDWQAACTDLLAACEDGAWERDQLVRRVRVELARYDEAQGVRA